MPTKAKTKKAKPAASAPGDTSNPPTVLPPPGETAAAEAAPVFDAGGCLRQSLIALKTEFDAFKANVTAELVKLKQKSL